MNNDSLNFDPNRNSGIKMSDIFRIGDLINACSDLKDLTLFYNNFNNLDLSKYGIYSKEDYSHPHFYYSFGSCFLVYGDEKLAKQALLLGSIFGLKKPCKYFDDYFVNDVGQCLSLIIRNYSIGSNDILKKLTCLAYVYLSKGIELFPFEMHDSYRERALLFLYHPSPLLIPSINPLFPWIRDPYIISDLYFASQATDSPFKKELKNAKIIYKSLDGINIGGKRGDKYSFIEMVTLGTERHNALYFMLMQNFMDDLYYLNDDEIIIFFHNLNLSIF